MYFLTLGLGTVVVVAAAAQPSSAVCTDAPVAHTQKKIKRKKKKISRDGRALARTSAFNLCKSCDPRCNCTSATLQKKNDSGVSFNATKQVTSDDLTNVPADVGRSMST